MVVAVAGNNRIIVFPPNHPILLMLYMFILFPLYLMAPGIFAYFSLLLGVPLRLAYFVGVLLFLLSVLLSTVNIVVRVYEAFVEEPVLVERYIVFFGIPISVPAIVRRVVRKKVVIAVNVGGALIPIATGTLLIVRESMRDPYTIAAAVTCILVVTAVTYAVSRAVPGVGIVSPAFIPPLVAAITAMLVSRAPTQTVVVAYAGGTLGTLLGADVLRLRKELVKFVKEYGPTVLSIGGAGTFDGIYLSGLLAAILTLPY